jgi:hypothetical protein
MNIIEAIKSGKPFARKGWNNDVNCEGWLFITPDNYIRKILMWDFSIFHFKFRQKDILAEDWIVKED